MDSLIGQGKKLRAPITSVRVQSSSHRFPPVSGHDYVSIWIDHGLAGTLTVPKENVAALVDLLVEMEASEPAASAPPTTVEGEKIPTPNLDAVVEAARLGEHDERLLAIIKGAKAELAQLKEAAEYEAGFRTQVEQRLTTAEQRIEAFKAALNAAGLHLAYTSEANLPLLTRKQLQDKIVAARTAILNALRDAELASNQS